MRWVGIFATLALSVAANGSRAVAQDVLPADAKPLSAIELFMLVKDRSWTWADGGGRFFDKDRRFLAFTRTKDGASFGEGRYLVTDSGRLCLLAAWHGAAATTEARTCFLHRQAGGVIYQRREEGGDWYAFKHTPLLDTDEYAKFTREDLVSGEFAKVKAEIEANGSVQKGN